MLKKGTAFERNVEKYLKHIVGLDVFRTGSKGDRGIDIQGTTNYPETLFPVVQCKNFKASIGPNSIREFNSSCLAFINRVGNPNIFALFIASSRIF